MAKCGSCGGNGWALGARFSQSRCLACNGTGALPEPALERWRPSPPPRARRREDGVPVNLEYRGLLKRYMRFVIRAEGVSCLERADTLNSIATMDSEDEAIAKTDLEALREIEAEIGVEDK